MIASKDRPERSADASSICRSRSSSVGWSCGGLPPACRHSRHARKPANQQKRRLRTVATPIAALALVCVLLIKEVPLRTTVLRADELEPQVDPGADAGVPTR